MTFSIRFSIGALLVSLMGCAHSKVETVSPEEAARLDKKLVKEAVVYEPGAKDGAQVPDVSAPRLRAVWVAEKVENNRLIEAHREWMLEGDVTILGTPKTKRSSK